MYKSKIHKGPHDFGPVELREKNSRHQYVKKKKKFKASALVYLGICKSKLHLVRGDFCLTKPLEQNSGIRISLGSL